MHPVLYPVTRIFRSVIYQNEYVFSSFSRLSTEKTIICDWMKARDERHHVIYIHSNHSENNLNREEEKKKHFFLASAF
jgi:hypothetical protein